MYLFSLETLAEVFFFFFQAEDGIRDLTVTGVQTCALPISRRGGRVRDGGAVARLQGVHSRLREQPAAAGNHPRPGAAAPRIRAAAAQSLVVHAVSGRAVPADGAR